MVQIPFADLAAFDGEFDVADNGGTARFTEIIANQDDLRREWDQLSVQERAALAQTFFAVPVNQSVRAKMRLSRARRHLRQLYQQAAAA